MINNILVLYKIWNMSLVIGHVIPAHRESLSGAYISYKINEMRTLYSTLNRNTVSYIEYLN